MEFAKEPKIRGVLVAISRFLDKEIDKGTRESFIQFSRNDFFGHIEPSSTF